MLILEEHLTRRVEKLAMSGRPQQFLPKRVKNFGASVDVIRQSGRQLGFEGD